MLRRTYINRSRWVRHLNLSLKSIPRIYRPQSVVHCCCSERNSKTLNAHFEIGIASQWHWNWGRLPSEWSVVSVIGDVQFEHYFPKPSVLVFQIVEQHLHITISPEIGAIYIFRVRISMRWDDGYLVRIIQNNGIHNGNLNPNGKWNVNAISLVIIMFTLLLRNSKKSLAQFLIFRWTEVYRSILELSLFYWKHLGRFRV